jgi:hypothetical protein
MRAMRVFAAIPLATVVALSGCSGGKEPSLMEIRSSSSTPDEFAILPNKPLEIPQDLAALPPPTPGGANRVDPTPIADAVLALGGNPARLSGAEVPGREAALVAQTTRFGVDGSIRQTLAAEDLEFRSAHRGRLLERLVGTTRYFKVYRPQAIDQDAELSRWRRAGVRTVGAPPPLAGQ